MAKETKVQKEAAQQPGRLPDQSYPAILTLTVLSITGLVIAFMRTGELETAFLVLRILWLLLGLIAGFVVLTWAMRELRTISRSGS